MASRLNLANGHTHFVVTAANGKRRTLRMGRLSPDDADEAYRRLVRIEDAHKAGRPLDKLTEAWIDSLDDENRLRVIRTGLVTVEQGGATAPQGGGRLDSLIDQWVATLDIEPQTLVGYKQHLEFLRRYFGNERDVTTILPADADKFRAWVIAEGRVNGDKPLSRSTVSRAVKTWRPLFEFAVRLRWLDDNPFAHLRASGEVNPERWYYIAPRLVDRLIEDATDPELAAMLALSRYATFRGPSEFKHLTWDDVDLPGGTIRIPSPKTKRYVHGASRLTPLEGMAHKQLDRLWQRAPEGAVLVLPRLGDSDSSKISQRLETLCRRLGIALWPKPWVNMRASCETDWQKAGRSIFETAEWMGHSPEMALRHYNRIAKDRVVDLPAALVEHPMRGASGSSQTDAQTDAPTSAFRGQ